MGRSITRRRNRLLVSVRALPLVRPCRPFIDNGRTARSWRSDGRQGCRNYSSWKRRRVRIFGGGWRRYSPLSGVAFAAAAGAQRIGAVAAAFCTTNNRIIFSNIWARWLRFSVRTASYSFFISLWVRRLRCLGRMPWAPPYMFSITDLFLVRWLRCPGNWHQYLSIYEARRSKEVQVWRKAEKFCKEKRERK